MRPYSDWIKWTRDHYLEALRELQTDCETKDPEDLRAIAAASAVIFALLTETKVHENEMLKHIHQLHGKDRPEA